MVYDPAGRLKRLRHTADGRTLGDFAYLVDKRGNRTQAYEAVPRATTGATTLLQDNPAPDYYRGAWAVNGAYRETTNVAGALRLAFFGASATLTMGKGADFSLYDVYVDGMFWRTIDGYASAAGDEAITLTLTEDGPHLLDIRNTAQRNPRNTSSPATYRLRFKSLATAAGQRQYDLRTLRYTYDRLARLADAQYFAGQNVSGTPFRRYQYTFDLAGNRTSEIVTVNGVPTTTNSTYDAANRLLNSGFSYDAAGRLLTDGTYTYTWDRADRPVDIRQSAHNYHKFSYDGLGRRVEYRNGEVQQGQDFVRRYLLDVQPGLWQTLAETDTGPFTSGTIRYVQGPPGTRQQDAGGAWQWLIPDALNSVRSVVDANNAILGAQGFAPFGVPDGMTGNSQTNFGFTGEPTDGTGQIYLRKRYYNPALGVFMSLDPVKGTSCSRASLNLYSYVDGNVMKYLAACGGVLHFNVLPGFGPTQYEISGVGRGIKFLYLAVGEKTRILSLACEEDTGREPAPEPVAVPEWVKVLQRLFSLFVIQ